jgi:hypothetical protein
MGLTHKTKLFPVRETPTRRPIGSHHFNCSFPPYIYVHSIANANEMKKWDSRIFTVTKLITATSGIEEITVNVIVQNR